MIVVVDALNKHRFGDLLTEMHRLRARVFEGRLGWEVNVEDGCERDEFDNLDPAHVIALDDDGHVVGCMRLLQTTGPHMLSDVFHSILDGAPPLRNAQLWEATRFCVDTNRLGRGLSRNSISYVTSEVMIGAFEYAQKAGVLDAVAVIDPVMDRVLKRSGNAPYDYVGTAKPMGKVTAMAALMDCSDARISAIRAYAGIDHDVFTPEDKVRAAFDRAMGKSILQQQGESMPETALEVYLRDLIENADSVEEQTAALALSAELASKLGKHRDLPETADIHRLA
ncbi:MAG: autoinducer synthase [Rhodobacterales bacterium]|nr:MAG: autoinducer synthase [Rhodobacterales bacterium]